MIPETESQYSRETLCPPKLVVDANADDLPDTDGALIPVTSVSSWIATG